MRILRISLRNLAALEGTHGVDFTREPLRSAGLFAISGPTGSGKSTLLDALCLALYEQTPRLEAVRGHARLPESGESILQNDPATLLRRGTSEGFAEVCFIGVDGLPYTARWSVRRARGKVDGALQNTEMVLLRGDVPFGTHEQVEASGRKTDVLRAIEAKLGLTFEQFTRAVLLAQNDFSAFLRADDRERAEILQTLTGTERFAKISIAVFARASQEQRRITELETRLAGQAPLSPDDRVTAESRLALAEKARTEAVGKLKEREQQVAWHERWTALETALRAANLDLEAAIRRREEAAPRRVELERTLEANVQGRPLHDAERRAAQECSASETRLRNATERVATATETLTKCRRAVEQTAEARQAAQKRCDELQPRLHAARVLDAQIVPARQRTSHAATQMDEARARALEARQRLEKLGATAAHLTQERQKLSTMLAPLEWLKPWVADSAAWIDRLDSAARADLESIAASETLRRARSDEETADRELAAARLREQSEKERTDQAAKALTEAEHTFAAFDPDRLRRERREMEAAQTALEALSRHLQQIEVFSRQCRESEGRLAALQSDITRDEVELGHLDSTEIPRAEQALQQARHTIELAESTATDASRVLRQRLLPDCPCPVCGSAEHPYASHPPDTTESVLRVLRSDAEAREKHLRERQSRAQALRRLLPSLRERAAKEAEDLQRSRSALSQEQARRFEHPRVVEVLAADQPSRTEAFAAAWRDVQDAVAQLDLAEQKCQAAEQALAACRRRRETAAQQLREAEKATAQLQTDAARLHAHRSHAATASERARALADKTRTEVAGLLCSWPGSRDDRSLDELRSEFTTACATFRETAARDQEVAAQLRDLEASKLHASEAIDRTRLELDRAQAQHHDASSALDRLVQERTRLLGDRGPDEIEAEAKGQLVTANEANTQAATSLVEAEKQLAMIRQAAQAEAEAGRTLQLRQQEANAALDRWMQAFSEGLARPMSRDDLLTLLARDEAWIRTEKAGLAALDDAVRNLEGAREAHRQHLVSHEASRPTSEPWDTVLLALEHWRRTVVELERARDEAQAMILSDDHRRQQSKAVAMELDACRTAASRWVRLNDLIGSSDGAKFRGIAQRQTLDILLQHANVQLDLVARRYRLERIPESLNLLVVDREMGDERRSVHSLSGGESFLVSLALALGLASLTSNRLRIESLFIDEGFGSLDPETLNTAMAALMQLESQGRKVGVISHVSEMTDAIPVQIRVVKGRAGASRLIVPGAPIAAAATELPSQPPKPPRRRKKISNPAGETRRGDPLRDEPTDTTRRL